MDLKSGYWQTKLDDASIPKTAFTTTDGHYEFVRTPFGLRNAPAQFSRMMQMTLGHLPFVEIYLDDLTIHSLNFEDHLSHLKKTLNVLRNANLKINKDKCTWFATTIKLLGHIVSGGQVHMDPAKVEAISKRRPPTNVKQVQEFLGLPNYYRRFIKDFSKIAAPIFNLLKKDVPFNWSKECDVAFNMLKERLTSYPIIRQPNFKKYFVLHTDASGFALGAILTQVDEIMLQKLSDYLKMDYVVAYSSRLLKGAEINYAITQKECLAIVWGIKQFHTYLYGKKFTVVTDHSALAWLNQMPAQNGRLARWAIYLQEYNFDIVYRNGSSHGNVDALSRPVLVAKAKQVLPEIVDENIKTMDPYEDEALLHYLTFRRHVSGASKKQIKRVEKLSNQYQLIENVLWYTKDENTGIKLRVPKRESRNQLVEQAHLLGHFSKLTTLKRLQEEYFWPQIAKDVEMVILKCMTCNRFNRAKTFHHPAKALQIVGLHDRIGIDLVLGLPDNNPQQYNGILVITEYLSKYAYAVPIKTKQAIEISDHLFQYICIFGPPKTLLSDQGKEFLNEVVDALLQKTGTEHRVTSAYHPNTNGLTERFNQTLVLALRKHTEANPNDWYKWLPYVLLSYRTRIHSTTGYSPFEIMFGRPMHTFHNWSTSPPIDDASSLVNRSIEIQNHFENTIPSVIQKIENMQDKQKDLQDKSKNILEEALDPGTTVYLQIEGLKGKLEPRYKGPYKIVSRNKNGNYKLQDTVGHDLQRSYPLEKLKISKDVCSDIIYEVEEI